MYHFPKKTFGRQRAGGRGPSASSPLSYAPPAGNCEQRAGAGTRSTHYTVLSPALRRSSATRESAYRYAVSSKSATARSFLPQFDGAMNGSNKASNVPASPPLIYRNQTMPSEMSAGGCVGSDDFLDIKRSASGGLFMRQSSVDRKKLSQQRALELSDIFEQSDSRDTQLNKLSSTSIKLKSTEYTATPSLKMVSVKEVAAQYAAKTELAERARKERHPNGDPLLTTSEKKLRERLETQNKRKEKLKHATKGSSDGIFSRELGGKANRVLQEGESSPKSVTNGPVISSPFTLPVDENGDPLYSSGLFSKKTHYERLELARAKAAHLSLESELSFDCNTDLNKEGIKVHLKATEMTAAPLLALTDLKDAAYKFRSLHGKQSDVKSPDKGMVWKPVTLSLGHELC